MPRSRRLILALVFSFLCEFFLQITSVHAIVTEQTLHSFNYVDGTNPRAGLVFDSAGNLYGTTSQDGPTGAGTVYELMSNGAGQWAYQTIYTFCSVSRCSDGIGPESGLIFDAAGNLYGTTSEGGNSGCGHGCGTVFQMTPSSDGGWTETVLYTFSGGDDGGTPVGGLIMDSAGNLYGTTSSGGPTSNFCLQGCGVVFRLQRGSNGNWTEKVLHSFCVGGCLDGAFPTGLTSYAGNLYCTTSQVGRYNGGTVVQLIPNLKGGWTGKLLYSFGKGSDGVSPNPGLVFDAAGNLYGTANGGGRYHLGTVFRLSPGINGQWTETTLHAFCSATNCLDGASPSAGLIMDAAGRLYGTAAWGGTAQDGTVFMLKLNTNGRWSEIVLYDGSSGSLDEPVIFDTSGNLFGSTSNGGSYNLGSVFEITP
jgi:uncharacterized repeat protein (TIGR03803 family)